MAAGITVFFCFSCEETAEKNRAFGKMLIFAGQAVQRVLKFSYRQG